MVVVDEKDSQTETQLRVTDFDSAAIRRLISEVRDDEPLLVGPRYDRTHNRHNR
jgi:hypothetical protein